MIEAFDAMPSYSYQGQDLFVMEVLGEQVGGFFLDSGASNGRKGSNTWLLESMHGWRGVCVEPNADTFRQLKANRDCICLDCCLYDRGGAVEFLEAAGVYGGIVEEYDARHLSFTRRVLGERWPDGAPAPTVRKVARTIRSVLRGADAPRTIDYWSLDTEGSELTLLKSFPYDEYRFRVLTVEHNNGPIREQIRSYLEGRGYVWVRDLGIDDGYVLADGAGHDVFGQAWRSAAWRGRRGACR
ncbi:FkbM family methyltransferase [Rhizobacter sp. Root1221]|uniref:FkbM family methyltransferase n=1 Tax=Rhizobacter sp. Root1221 TaxID=1736433 RepID=UPI0006F8B1AE|nr:FkbM family methyltransferase [Rhizobacter sp. Root1221]KQW02841.1 FkbM family methyltransferase [Rhizobacter sp. Root1221]